MEPRNEKEESKLEKEDSGNQFYKNIFKMEVKFEMNPCESEVGALKFKSLVAIIKNLFQCG